MKIFVASFLGLALFASSALFCHAVVLHDFEDGLYNANDEHIANQAWQGGGTFHTFTIDSSVKKEGNQSLKITCNADDNLNPILAIKVGEVEQYQGFIRELHNANYDRMSFYIKLPGNYPLSPGGPAWSYHDFNFNVGTYSINPALTEPLYSENMTDGDYHYYHYAQLKGNDTYWTKIVLNNHPDWWCESTGPSDNDPTPEPANINNAWQYFNGFTRFYMQLLPDNVPAGVTTPMDIWLDDLEVYDITEAENDDHVSSIACLYEGSGNFWMSWRGNNMYDLQHPASAGTHEYEVYYSTSPLTNANYSTTGTKASVNGDTTFKGGLNGDEGGGVYYGVMTGTFNTGITSGTAYFAIKDISDGSTVVSKIDYEISETASDTTPPSSPTGLDVQ